MSNPPLNPWQIWWVDFPFADKPGFKRRPAIILQPFPDGDINCMYVTSKIAKQRPDLLLLNDWQKEGLAVPSAVRFQRRSPIRPEQLLSYIGILTQTDRKRIILSMSTF